MKQILYRAFFIGVILFLLCSMYSLHNSPGGLQYAYYFFREIYILALIALFGFLLTSTILLQRTRGIQEVNRDTPFFLVLVFICGVAFWLQTLIAINGGNLLSFCILAFICVAFAILLVAMTIFQIDISSSVPEEKEKKKSTSPAKRKRRTTKRSIT